MKQSRVRERVYNVEKKLNNIRISGAKEFTAEAMKATSEYANKASEMLQEKVPEVIEGMSVTMRKKEHNRFSF